MTPGANPIRILIVDDHPLLREGIAAVLGCHADLQVVGEASDGAQAVAEYQRCRPDVTLMDLQMPGLSGMEATTRIRSIAPAARILVLTTYKGDVQALRAFKAGASGYLLKSALRKELVEAIRSVHGGRRLVPREIAEDMALHSIDDALSERETEVLRQVAAGNSNKQVAILLGVTEDTVKAHMKHILAKLSAQDRTHAVTIALRRGILSL